MQNCVLTYKSNLLFLNIFGTPKILRAETYMFLLYEIVAYDLIIKVTWVKKSNIRRFF